MHSQTEKVHTSIVFHFCNCNFLTLLSDSLNLTAWRGVWMYTMLASLWNCLCRGEGILD